MPALADRCVSLCTQQAARLPSGADDRWREEMARFLQDMTDVARSLNFLLVYSLLVMVALGVLLSVLFLFGMLFAMARPAACADGESGLAQGQVKTSGKERLMESRRAAWTFIEKGKNEVQAVLRQALP